MQNGAFIPLHKTDPFCGDAVHLKNKKSCVGSRCKCAGGQSGIMRLLALF